MRAAVEAVDPTSLPVLTPHVRRGKRPRAMKTVPATPELLRVAQRVMWFEEPVRALADPVQFLAHVMVFGTVEGLQGLARHRP